MLRYHAKASVDRANLDSRLLTEIALFTASSVSDVPEHPETSGETRKYKALSITWRVWLGR